MSQGLPKRLVALLGAIFFLLGTTGEGFGLYPCPFHDGLLRDGVVEHFSAGSGSPDQTGYETGHTHSEHQHSGAEVCTHVGACQPPSGIVLSHTFAANIVWTYRVARVTELPPSEWIAPFYPPFFIPYSLAPPAHG